MNASIALYIGLILCFALSYASGQTLERPENTAVVERKHGRVNCTASPGSDVLVWSHSLFGSKYTFWQSDATDSTDPRFTVEVNEAAGRYDLIIIQPNSTCAGTFHVALQSAGPEYDVEVVVLSGLNCHPEETGKETEEGLELVVTASTAFYGRMEPSMRWYSAGQLLPSHVWHINNTKSVQSNMTATPELHGSEYSGVLLFEENEAGLTPPSLTETCSTFYKVLYGAQDMSIVPHPGEDEELYAPPGSLFNCSAIGNPDPDFYWYCNNGLIKAGSMLTVPEDALDDMTCICEGQNVVNGRLQEASTNVTFTTSSANRPPTGTAWSLSLCTFVFTMLSSKRS